MSEAPAFEKFPKIDNLQGALLRGHVPSGEYLISEKMDGANAGILRTEEGLLLHSRNMVVAEFIGDQVNVLNSFRGFPSYVEQHLDSLYLQLAIGQHVYGEWLVPHTLSYPAEMYSRFYAFPEQGLDPYAWPMERVLEHPMVISIDAQAPDERNFAAVDQALTEMVKESSRPVEGIVIQSLDGQEQRFKVVQPEFRESAKGRWNPKAAKKAGEIEQAMAMSFSERQYVKIREKAFDLKGALDKEHTPVILGLAWYDFAQENLADQLQKYKFPVLDTQALRKEVQNRAREMFHTELDTGMLPQWASNSAHSGFQTHHSTPS